jgi:hypothetical protein
VLFADGRLADAFSGPGPTAQDAAGGVPLRAVACASVSQCTALDNKGREVTFDPTSPGVPTPIPIDPEKHLAGLACPSVSQCTAADHDGREVTFNPRSPRRTTHATVDRDHQKHLAGLACPSVRQCTAVDAYNEIGPVVQPPEELPHRLRGLEVVTFNPRSPGTTTHAVIDASRFQAVPYGIACPSARQCTVVSEDEAEVAVEGPTGEYGEEVTFNPTRGFKRGPAPEHPSFTGAWNPKLFLTAENAHVVGMACAAARQCTVIAECMADCTIVVPGSEGPSGDRQPAPPFARVVTFNPASPSKATRAPIAILDQFTCPSVSQCTGVTEEGQAVTFNPGSPGSPTPTTIDKAGISAIACPSLSECTAVDDHGQEVTFNPDSPGSPTPTTID